MIGEFYRFSLFKRHADHTHTKIEVHIVCIPYSQIHRYKDFCLHVCVELLTVVALDQPSMWPTVVTADYVSIRV